MNELQLQSLVIDSVRDSGGAAFKLSNRFLIGVCDLLLKVPDRPAALVEVKLQRLSNRTRDDFRFVLDVTVPQRDFLTSFASAGMLCGVLSGIVRSNRQVSSLSLCIDSLDDWRERKFMAQVRDHTAIGVGAQRAVDVMNVIEQLYRRGHERRRDARRDARFLPAG